MNLWYSTQAYAFSFDRTVINISNGDIRIGKEVNLSICSWYDMTYPRQSMRELTQIIK